MRTGVVLEVVVRGLVEEVVGLDVVLDEGFFTGLVVGLVLVGRLVLVLVLPPAIMPPPLAGSCCASAMFALSRQVNTEREISGRRRRVDIRYSPAAKTAVEVMWISNVTRKQSVLLAGIIVVYVAAW